MTRWCGNVSCHEFLRVIVHTLCINVVVWRSQKSPWNCDWCFTSNGGYGSIPPKHHHGYRPKPPLTQTFVQYRIPHSHFYLRTTGTKSSSSKSSSDSHGSNSSPIIFSIWTLTRSRSSRFTIGSFSLRTKRKQYIYQNNHRLRELNIQFNDPLLLTCILNTPANYFSMGPNWILHINLSIYNSFCICLKSKSLFRLSNALPLEICWVWSDTSVHDGRKSINMQYVTTNISKTYHLLWLPQLYLRKLWTERHSEIQKKKAEAPFQNRFGLASLTWCLVVWPA